MRANLAISDVAGAVAEELPAPQPTTPRSVLISLEALLANLMISPVFEPWTGGNAERSAATARQLQALIDFTEPVRLAHSKDCPLEIGVLLELLMTADRERTLESVNRQAEKLVRKRCVDFIDNGTNFWALRTVGAGENVMKEIDTCLSAESRAIILNRLAATPESEQTVSRASVFGDVVRFLYSKKDQAGRKRFLEAGREFIRRFGDELCSVELVEWLKATIPKAQAAFEKMPIIK